jgi:hypothetical protein
MGDDERDQHQRPQYDYQSKPINAAGGPR